MLQNFTKYAGIVQTLIGLLGQFAPSLLGSLMGAQAAGGNVFNILSGAALSYLGFKGTPNTQRTGAQVVGGLNGLVGLLGAFGVNNLAGLQMNDGWGSTIVNLLIGAWGLYSGFVKKTAGATAH
ncbi:MAG: hypothetical protein ACRENG_17090 [bacterium]